MSVRDHDERWDELALGHVLGGLAASDASSFRTHLASCEQCRRRVAELRTLDSHMAAAAREERETRRIREGRRGATRTEARSDDDPPEDTTPAPPADGPRWRTVIAVALTAVLLGGLALWNAHLRTQHAYLTEIAESQDETLGVIGRGTVVPVTTSGDVTGVVSVDGDQVAYALAGVPEPEPGEWLVVWIRDEGGARSVDVLPSRALADGVLRSSIPAVDAEALVLTIESEPGASTPSGDVVLEADLPGAPPEPRGG